MGSVVKSISGLFGGGGGGTAPKVNTQMFDVKKDVQDRTKQSRDASLGLVDQLQAQSRGEGPSLAQAQMKAAQDRNLSQLLAMSAAQRGGNAAARQRQVAQSQSNMGRQLAQDAGTLRLQEQQQAQQMLGAQALSQQGQDLAQVMQPGQLAAQGEQARYAADAERVRQVRDQQGGILSGLLGAGGATLSSALGPVGTVAGGTLGSAIGGGGGQYGTPNFYAGGAVKSDKPENDVVEAKLSPGEMVVPRTVVAEGADAIKSFADAILAKQSEEPQKEAEGFGAIIAAQQELEKRLKKLEGRKRK